MTRKKTYKKKQKFCPNCNALVGRYSEICKHCGYKLIKRCPICGDYLSHIKQHFCKELKRIVSKEKIEEREKVEREKKIVKEKSKRESDYWKRKLEVMPEQEVIESMPEEQSEELEVLQEEIEIIALEEQPEKLEILQEKIISASDEITITKEILQEEVVAITPKEQPEELIPPEPQIIKCPFCGIEINEETTFCPQCGMTFKKK